MYMGFGRFKAAVFSPVELDWLAKNKKQPIEQLCIQLAKSRNAIKRQLSILDGKTPPGKKNKKSVIGKRKDLNNLFFRSQWEANFCRILKYEKIDFFYEPKVFYFEGVKRGTMSYLPDIYLPELDIYIEIKGQLTSQGRVAVNRFKKYFPEEAAKLQAVTGRENTKATEFFKKIGVPIYGYYYDLQKKYKPLIKEWEE